MNLKNLIVMLPCADPDLDPQPVWRRPAKQRGQVDLSLLIGDAGDGGQHVGHHPRQLGLERATRQPAPEVPDAIASSLVLAPVGLEIA